MEILIEKSKENEDAAKLLIMEGCYASSVHCSYYSFIQRMRHILFNNLNYSENDFDNNDEVKSAGSHNYLISIFRDELKRHNIDSRNFHRRAFDLKSLRHNADYKQVRIFENDGKKALELSQNLCNTLTTQFQ